MRPNDANPPNESPIRFVFESQAIAELLLRHYETEAIRSELTRDGMFSDEAERRTKEAPLAGTLQARSEIEGLLIAEIRAHGLDPWCFRWTFGPVEAGGTLFFVELVRGKWPGPPWPARQVIRLTPFEAGLVSFIFESEEIAVELERATLLAVHKNGLAQRAVDGMLFGLTEYMLGHSLDRESHELSKRGFAALPWRNKTVPQMIKRWRKAYKEAGPLAGNAEMESLLGHPLKYSLSDLFEFLAGDTSDRPGPSELACCQSALDAHLLMIDAMNGATGDASAMCYPWGELPAASGLDPLRLLRGMSITVAKGFIRELGKRLDAEGEINASVYEIGHRWPHVRLEEPATWEITAELRASVALALSGDPSHQKH